MSIFSSPPSEAPYRITVEEMEVVVTPRRTSRSFRMRYVVRHAHFALSVPLQSARAKVERFVADHLDWMRRAAGRFVVSTAEAQYEEIQVLGVRYPVRWIDDDRLSVARRREVVEVYTPSADRAEAWPSVQRQLYRAALEEVAPPMIARWSARMGVEVAEWNIRDMHTRWGTCNVRCRRVWLRQELGRLAPELIELIVVHELCHLIERGHSPRFKALMSSFLPHWRALDHRLKRER